MDINRLKAIRGIQQDGFIASPEQIRKRCIYISEVREFSTEQKERNLRAIIIDNADGVYVCRKGTLVYSWLKDEENRYYVSSANSTLFGTYDVSSGKRIPLELETIKHQPTKYINIFKEVSKMENKKFNDMFESKLQDIAAEASGVATEVSTGEPVKANTVEQVNAFNPAPVTGLTQADSRELENAEKIAEFARKYGKVQFYLTNKEPELSFKAKKVFEKDAEGRFIPADKNDEEVAQKLRSGNSKLISQVKASQKASHYELQLKQDRPAIKFMVYSVPAGLANLGLESLASILDGKVEVDMKDTAEVLKVVPKKFIPHVINTTFCGIMPESPKTHKNCASKLRVKQIQGTIRQGKASTSGPVKKLSVVFDKSVRPSQLVDGNFFPLKVAKKINLSHPQTNPEELNATIQGAFAKIFSIKQALGSKSQYDLLKVEHKALLSQDAKTGEISTELINAKGNVDLIKENLEIVGWHKEIRPEQIELAIPARIKKESKNGKASFPIQYFDCTAAKARNDEAYAAQTSIQNGQYATLVEEFGAILNFGRLQSLTKATRKSSSQEDLQSAEKQRYDALLSTVQELKGLVSGQSEEGMTKAEVSRFLELTIEQ